MKGRLHEKIRYLKCRQLFFSFTNAHLKSFVWIWNELLLINNILNELDDHRWTWQRRDHVVHFDLNFCNLLFHNCLPHKSVGVSNSITVPDHTEISNLVVTFRTKFSKTVILRFIPENIKLFELKLRKKTLNPLT